MASETQSGWYNIQTATGPSNTVDIQTFQQYKMEVSNSLLNIRNEIMNIRNEVLSLRQTCLTFTENFNKLKPIIDERKKNNLIRQHQPFSFIPEHVDGNTPSQKK